jgi:hypothetical protein
MLSAGGARDFLLIALMPFMLVACGSAVQKLPDDPDNEPNASWPSQPPPENGSSAPANDGEQASLSAAERQKILAQYPHLDPLHEVPDLPLEEAVIYFHRNKSQFKNQNVISVIDYTQSSQKKRWHLIDLKSGSVWSLHVAHGKGSDRDHDGFAESFSNIEGSNSTSLGFYQTAETYQGKWGYSLRLDGLSPENSNVRRRSVVVHGASYVLDQNVIQGRTWGCPAVSMANHKRVIDLIKGGSLIYAVGNKITPLQPQSKYN